ncbi:MAG: hydrogenase maturation nickel metallochaperone HypA [Gammaproteobacteria bacterium]|nr:hydrogenase maturation nickel metallochaperone HypA [Gammaproteobacteria bacterium]
MHELSVCQALIEQVTALATEHEAAAVEKVMVKLGPLSGVEATLLQRAYPVACAGTIAESSELIIESATIKVFCNTCGQESEATANRLLCGVCGDWRTRLVNGDEMLLTSVSMMTDSQTQNEPKLN